MPTEEDKELQWYALHTQPRAEKIAAKGLERLGIENYLPIVQRLRTWSDRKKWVDLPLFNGYIFVKANIIQQVQRRRILEAPKITRFVLHEGIPVVVSEVVIRSIRILCAEWNDEFRIENESVRSSLREGDEIVIMEGPLKGVEGVLTKIKNFPRVIVFIEAIGQGISFELSQSSLEKKNPLNARL